MALQGFPQFLTNFNDFSMIFQLYEMNGLGFKKTKKHFMEYPTNNKQKYLNLSINRKKYIDYQKFQDYLSLEITLYKIPNISSFSMTMGTLCLKSKTVFWSKTELKLNHFY